MAVINNNVIINIVMYSISTPPFCPTLKGELLTAVTS